MLATARSTNWSRLRSIVVGVWELESGASPADWEARQIEVTLAQSGPRYVSADLAFAVWSATLSESREGEAVTVTGPLGQVGAGERLVCSGAFSRHPRYGWQFSVERFAPRSRSLGRGSCSG